MSCWNRKQAYFISAHSNAGIEYLDRMRFTSVPHGFAEVHCRMSAPCSNRKPGLPYQSGAFIFSDKILAEQTSPGSLLLQKAKWLAYSQWRGESETNRTGECGLRAGGWFTEIKHHHSEPTGMKNEIEGTNGMFKATARSGPTQYGSAGRRQKRRMQGESCYGRRRGAYFSSTGCLRSM